MFPILHGFVGWQLTPAAHELHVPPLHTLLIPQDVPFVTFPLSAQTEVPVEQEVSPVLQGFVGWQLTLALHEPHVPLLHTLLVPQDVPFVTFPLSAQTEVPVEQEVIPILQGFVGWQLTPEVHEPHVPLSHTLLVPQDVPSATFPVSAQTDVPVEQEVIPVLHGFAGWQPRPAVHEPQVPLPHTLLVPQDVPFAMFPVSTQTEVPVIQDVVPDRHGFAGWQLTAAVHAAQVPLPQTLFVPQDVPLARFWPVSAQEIVGEQTVIPA